MDLKKIVASVMLLALAVPMVSSVVMAWNFNFDWVLNASGVYITYPNQAFNQTLPVTTIDLNAYYFINNSKPVSRASLNDTAGIDPLFVYDNSSGNILKVILNSTGSVGLDKCELYIKPQNGTATILTSLIADIEVPLGMPANGTAYWVANKFKTTSEDCLQRLWVSQ